MDLYVAMITLCNTYNMGSSDLPEIYAGYAMPERKCVYERQFTSAHFITNSYIPLHLRLIAYYTDSLLQMAKSSTSYAEVIICIGKLEKFDYGSSKNVAAMCINMNRRKWVDIMKITESSNKQFYNCFMAVTMFKNCFIQSNKDLKALVYL